MIKLEILSASRWLALAGRHAPAPEHFHAFYRHLHCVSWSGRIVVPTAGFLCQQRRLSFESALFESNASRDWCRHVVDLRSFGQGLVHNVGSWHFPDL